MIEALALNPASAYKTKRMGSSLSRLSQAVTWSTLTASIALLIVLLGRHLPWGDWLVFRYLGYWALSVALFAAWFSVGHSVLSFVFRRRQLTIENLLLSTALGFFVFLMGWTLIGFAHGYGTVSFVAWPLVCLSLGAAPIFKRRKRFGALFRRLKSRTPKLSALELSMIVYGAIFTFLAYAAILTPQNVAFDARWYHMPIAERYAVMGGIERYSEGWFLAGYPQFVPILFSWAFSLPSPKMFDLVELATHIEFAIFLATLASVPIVARRLLPKGVPLRVVRHSWVAVFLFPELFVYDSSINGGADHIVTFWAVPVALATMRVYRRFSMADTLVLAVFVAAIVLTKYTAGSLLIGPALLLAGRAVWLVVSGLRGRGVWWRPLVSSLSLVGCVVVLTAPLWLKNLLWYRDPLFPLLHTKIEPTPFTPETIDRMASYMVGGVWKAPPGMTGVLKTLQHLYLFPFVPNDWATFHKDWPMFGFLFTLLVPTMLVARSRRLIVVMLWAHAGVLFWYWTFHQDRYLQALVPWMSACVAVSIAWLFRTGRVHRVLTSLLIVLQVAWGLDAPFFGTHMAGQPLKVTIDFLAGGLAGQGQARLVAFPEFESIGKALPEGSVLLRHEIQVHAGVRTPTVSDWFQTGISWGTHETLGEVHDTLKSHGVTHVMWVTGSSRAFDSYAADINFFTYAKTQLEDVAGFGVYSVGRLGEHRPQRDELRVLYLGCDGSYEKGLYPVTALNVMPNPTRQFTPADFPTPQEPVETPLEAIRLLRRSDVVVHNRACMNLSASLQRAKLLFRRLNDEVYLLDKRRK